VCRGLPNPIPNKTGATAALDRSAAAPANVRLSKQRIQLGAWGSVAAYRRR